MSDAEHAPTPGPDERPSPPPERKKFKLTKKTLAGVVVAVLIVFGLGAAVIYLSTHGAKERIQTASVVTVPDLGSQIAKGMEPFLKALTERLNATDTDVKTLKTDTADIKKQVSDLQQKVEDLEKRPVVLDTKQLDESIKKSLEQTLPPLLKSHANYSAVPVPPAKPRATEAKAAPIPQKPAPRAKTVPVPPRKPAMELRKASAPLACKAGDVVRQSAGTFRIDTLVVEDGSGVVSTIGQVGASYAAWGVPLLNAARHGSVSRFSGNGSLVFHLLNIDSAKLPARIPYLDGEARCAGEAAVEYRDNGFADVEIPIDGGHRGQVSLVLPVDAVSSPGAAVCVQADFSLAYAPRLTAGSYKGAKNVVCDQSFRKPLSAGFRGEMLVLIHGQAKEI